MSSILGDFTEIVVSLCVLGRTLPGHGRGAWQFPAVTPALVTDDQVARAGHGDR